MTKEQIESLKRMVNSNNVNDIVLACQIIYQNKPFDHWRSLAKLAKMNYSRSMAKQTKKWGFYWGVEQLPDNTFLKKILEIPMSKTLYKKDSNGNVRYLKIWTEKDELVQESGVIGTDNPIEHRKTCKGKNIGKSNETTPEKQAKLEMQSKIAEKLKEDYFEKLESAKSEQVILPMLAKVYKDHKHKIDWDKPVYVQRKYDGQRCLAYKKDGKVVLMSRLGTEIETMDHIKESLKDLKVGVILDGELYSRELGSFQEQMKAIKKFRPGISDKIQYHIYDLVEDKPFSSRTSTIFNMVMLKPLIKVETFTILNEEDLKNYHQQFVSEGYEGSMVRFGDSGYKINGRSENLLKYKDFQDIALPIIDITENDANPKHGTPWFELKGKKFKAGCKLSHEDREDLLTNKDQYIGKTAELRYFELSEDGICRFPVMVGIRLDK